MITTPMSRPLSVRRGRSIREREVIGNVVRAPADVIQLARVPPKRKALLAEKGGAYRWVVRRSDTDRVHESAG